MSQIRTRLKTPLEETEFDRSLVQELLSAWRELSAIMNGGLKFSDNFNAVTVNVPDTGTANVEFTVSHTLKRVPDGFLITNRTGTGVVYKGSTAWTSTAIYLKCTTANNNINVFVF